MNDKSKKTEKPAEGTIEAKEPRFRAWAYYADIVKWFISLIGVVVDHVKANKLPRKDDYKVI